MLPVGDADDVARVLALVLPEFATVEHREVIAAGMTSRGRDDFVGSPRRAAWIRPFSWQRTGYRLLDGSVLLRRGFVWRSLAIVPLARLQSLELEQGPIDRLLGLAGTRLHTVSGPVHPRLAAIDVEQSRRLFDAVAAGAISSAQSDSSHRWRTGAPALPPPAFPGLVAEQSYLAPPAFPPPAFPPPSFSPPSPAPLPRSTDPEEPH